MKTLFLKEKKMCHLKSYQLAIKFYRQAVAVSLPYYLKDQLRRASLSIALNISEGTGRRTVPDRVRFFQIAMGSIRECQTIVELESGAFNHEAKEVLDHLAAATYNLIKNSKL